VGKVVPVAVFVVGYCIQGLVRNLEVRTDPVGHQLGNSRVGNCPRHGPRQLL